MKNIFLPFEVLERELFSRAFLSVKLAKNGHRVFLFEHTYFDRIGWPGKGIYLGKNCFRTEIPHSSIFYDEMKRKKIKVWFLDEEGGVYSGNSEEEWKDQLDKRFDLSGLKEDDKILCWGKWQKNHLQNKNLCASIFLSGSPNYDVFQKKYNRAFKNYDIKLTGGRKNFILVNTRFSLGNARLGIDTTFDPDKSAVSKLKSRSKIINSYVSNNLIMYSMIQMIITVAKRNPHKHFIVRPHPNESKQIYEYMFLDSKNVDVIRKGPSDSWVRLSDALIHNGCSTAIQANIAGKNVISYVPSGFEDDSTTGLPNTVGHYAKNSDEVNEIINNLDKYSPNKNNYWENTISNLNSIDFISELVESEDSKDDNNRISLNRNNLFIEKLKDKISSILNRKRSKYADLSLINSIKNSIKIANSHYDSDVICQKISNGCYLIQK